MSRQMIRDMKRTVAAGTRPGASTPTRQRAKESALALLDRSISFGHDRLAVIRLSMAVDSGAEVSHAHWRYCEETVKRCRDVNLLVILHQARHAAALPLQRFTA